MSINHQEFLLYHLQWTTSRNSLGGSHHPYPSDESSLDSLRPVILSSSLFPTLVVLVEALEAFLEEITKENPQLMRLISMYEEESSVRRTDVDVLLFNVYLFRDFEELMVSEFCSHLVQSSHSLGIFQKITLSKSHDIV